MKVLINNVEYHNKYKFSFTIIIPEEQVYSTRIFNKILFLTITKKNHKFSFSMQFAFSASHSSPTIFPFFENRAYTTWKNHVCVCVCGNRSLPRNSRKTWIRSRVWCLSRSMADTKPEYGAQIKRLPVELVRARSEYWKRVALVTCLVSKTPETRLCRGDSPDRSKRSSNRHTKRDRHLGN